MTSNNYAVYGHGFSLEGTFRLLRTTALPEPLVYDEVVDCGTITNPNELKESIAKAKSLRFVDFGNGLRGLHGECDGFHFCAVHEHKESVMIAPATSEKSDPEDIF